jgi:hypothetical protein
MIQVAPYNGWDLLIGDKLGIISTTDRLIYFKLGDFFRLFNWWLDSLTNRYWYV